MSVVSGVLSCSARMRLTVRAGTTAAAASVAWVRPRSFARRATWCARRWRSTMASGVLTVGGTVDGVVVFMPEAYREATGAWYENQRRLSSHGILPSLRLPFLGASSGIPCFLR